MKRQVVYILPILILTSAFSACKQENTASRAETLAPPLNQNMRQATIALIENLWKPAAGEPIVFDGQKFFADHRSEIIETLEVVDTLTVGDIGVALIRYSLGTDIYRSAVWMRRIEDSWFPTGSQYFSKYSDEYEAFKNETKEQADKMIEKAESWEEESKKTWWKW